MKMHTTIVLLFLFLLLLFAAVNWNLVSQVNTINLLFLSVQAPLGFIFLGAISILSLLFILLASRMEIAAMIKEHKNQKALEEARELALDKEKSRISELRQSLEVRFGEFRELFAAHDRQLRKLEEHCGRIEQKTDTLIDRFDEEGVFIVKESPDTDPADPDDRPAS